MPHYRHDIAWIALAVLAASVPVSVKGQQGASRARQDHPSFVQIDDQPGLPRVLLLGDSISMQYTLAVREKLQGVANVHRPATNCRSTRQTLAEIDAYLGSGSWDVIHFNCGIHDLTHLGPDGKVAAPPEGKLQVPLEEYESNLKKLVDRLQQSGAVLIWASTTPIGMQTESKGYRRDRDVVNYNAAAARIMAQENVAVNDLYSTVKPRAEELLRDGVHFNGPGASVLADRVASVIQQSLTSESPKR